MDLPWQFNSDVDDDARWRLDLLAEMGIVLAIATLAGQWQFPAPYGRHDPKDGKWGPQVNQRIGHVLNDGLWGVGLFLYLLYKFSFCIHFGSVNTIFALLWLCHFVHRGILHPLLMRYSSPTTALGIPITGVTLAFFSYALATFLCSVTYTDNYLWNFRFLSGLAIFAIGFAINRHSDWTLRRLRPKSGVAQYEIPEGGLFDLVTCPNYFGEMVQWLGWALATWSWIGFAYFCFASATFVPRARHHRRWYEDRFEDYPADRKSLVPFLF